MPRPLLLEGYCPRTVRGHPVTPGVLGWALNTLVRQWVRQRGELWTDVWLLSDSAFP